MSKETTGTGDLSPGAAVIPPSMGTGKLQKIAPKDLPPSDLNPAQKELENRLQTTKLDKVLVVCVSINQAAAIWFRLIGPGQILNLELGAPKPGSVEAVWEITTRPVPKLHQNLVEYNVEGDGYSLAGAYALLGTYRIARWDFPEQAVHGHEKLILWALHICAYMDQHGTFTGQDFATVVSPLSLKVNPTLPRVYENEYHHSPMMEIEQLYPTIAGTSAKEDGGTSFQTSTTSSVKGSTWTSRGDSPDTTSGGTQAGIHAGTNAGIVSQIPEWPQRALRTCQKCKQGKVICISKKAASCEQCHRLNRSGPQGQDPFDTEEEVLSSDPQAEILHLRFKLESIEKSMEAIRDHNYALTHELERLRNLDGNGRTLPAPRINVDRA